MTKSPASPRPVRTGRYRYTKWRWRISVGLLDALGGLIVALWGRLRPRAEAGPTRKILVVQLDHMGDAILSSPIFPRLRALYPGATIDVLASPSNREVFEADPEIDEVHLADRNWFDRRPGRRALGSAVWALGRSLRGRGYDLGIDVRGDVLTVFVLALAGIPRRLGWAMGGGGFLLTDVADWVPGRHEVESRLALLAKLDAPADLPARVRVHATDRDRARVARRLRDAWPVARAASRVPARVGRKGTSDFRSHPNLPDDDAPGWLHAGRFGEAAPMLAVHLGAGAAAKRWPARHWRELIGRFLQDGWRVVMVGGPDDVATAATVAPHAGLRDWTGRLALAETVALMERADLFIGSDSGPAHLAASTALPSVILFSGTNRPRQWRPWSRRALVLRQKVACRPCHHKACPLADHPCMSGLAPDRVHRAALRWHARLRRAEVAHAPA
ncbi:glycosyltransferase family 9 protein [Tundrisphaera sp. TA3]|uniref:glycosyltransferase family 9 protein n=1 Tax=Tundrisphaera sp. TA3 TaxID=3435775 RepID=UPI003EBFACBF